ISRRCQRLPVSGGGEYGLVGGEFDVQGSGECVGLAQVVADVGKEHPLDEKVPILKVGGEAGSVADGGDGVFVAVDEQDGSGDLVGGHVGVVVGQDRGVGALEAGGGGGPVAWVDDG